MRLNWVNSIKDMLYTRVGQFLTEILAGQKFYHCMQHSAWKNYAISFLFKVMVKIPIRLWPLAAQG